jgi:hypothetical protein
MKTSSWSFRVIRRAAIGVGTFLFGWGWVGVVPVTLPVSLPAITLPSFEWLGGRSASLGSLSMSAVPEPASWLMMIGGMLILGAALRSHPRRALRAAY